MALRMVDCDLLAMPWFEGEGADAVSGLDAATGGEVGRAIRSGEFNAELYQVFVTPIVDAGWCARRVVLVGAAKRGSFDDDVARKIATVAGMAARERRAERTAFLLRAAESSASGGRDCRELVQPVTEGLTLSEFDGALYKTTETNRPNSPAWSLVGYPDGDGDAAAAIERGRTLAHCSNLARGLVAEPGNRLTPREFVRRVEGIVAGCGVAVDVLDESRIAELGMGLLLGVGQGSSEPPRLIVLRHDPPGAPDKPVLGLVGKGVTFDSGGISIKSADGMERMKDDMAGGAAVACALRAIATLGAPIRVIGVIPSAENMPGGRALKPGDVLTSASGKTVEVVNTDAEGRLVLGDGLWYAQQLGATHLIDIATLTGGCVVALGKITSGLFGTPSAFVNVVQRVADRAGDRAWPMPLFDEYRVQLKSEIADVMNSGGRPASAITAAMFLKEFSGGLPWVHIDIAGTAWTEEARPYLPKGASGAGVRTLAELAFTSSEWPDGIG
jgi:leucyl aminopeptidase